MVLGAQVRDGEVRGREKTRDPDMEAGQDEVSAEEIRITFCVYPINLGNLA